MAVGDFLTERGKADLEQAKRFNMLDFYDEFTGVFTIPKKKVDFDPQLKNRMFDMLISWECFGSGDNPKLALTVEVHIEDGEEIDGEWDYLLQVVDTFC